MELTLDQALQKGIEAHKAGKVREADQYYTAILKANPKHPDANHNMGVLAVGLGKVEEALPFFKTALEANPNIDQYWLSYTDALIKLDRIDEAKEVFNGVKSKGTKGDGFDQLEKRLGSPSSNISESQEPHQEELQSLIKLYSLRQFQEVLNKAAKLLKQFPNSIHLYNIIGVANSGLGKLNEAIEAYTKVLSIKPDYAEVYNNMGNALKGQSNLEEAIEAYNKAISLQPDYPEAHHNIGIALQDKGKLHEAIEAYNRALLIKPDYAEVYNNMGNALKSLSKLEEAIEVYKKALTIRPGYPEAYNNLGVSLKANGKLGEAIQAYNRALAIKPDYPEAHYNMGLSLQANGKLGEAIQAYNRALAIKPDYSEAYYNMGIALQANGKLGEAIEAYNKALLIKPDYAEVCYTLGNALNGVTFNKPNRGLQKNIALILDNEAYVRPKDIAISAISLLKFEPIMEKLLEFNYSINTVEDLVDVITELNELPLLLMLMSVCPIPDIKVEKLLKYLRSSLLSNILNIRTSPQIIKFQTALALQCFTNEYIYDHTEDDVKAILDLEEVIKKAFENNKQPNPQLILTLASYRALNQYDWCNMLAVTDEIVEVFKRQVEEPQKEKDLKPKLAVLVEITDKVSSKVREQYEESPYPRWINMGFRSEPTSISDVVNEINLRLFNKEIVSVEIPEILIAGCGTGQHSIGSAKRFKYSKLLAIDLSLASLAYAKRKTDELNIENIEYMQGDILDLGKLSRQFDIIESGGVLHHMEDPMAGWKVLANCLKPGGLMKIGLYSELGRQHIAKIKDEMGLIGVRPSETKMKSIRDIIKRSSAEHHKLLLNSNDFYSLSTLRDLLFHVQEHRFTIPQIKKCLVELGLKFCGFEGNMLKNLLPGNLHDNNPYNLDAWHIYEEYNPTVFSGMYQFWCQKVD